MKGKDAKRRGPKLGPPPPIGTAYLLRFQDVAFRLRMSVNRTWKLQREDQRFPRPVQPPTRSRGKSGPGLKLYLEQDVATYVAALAAERDAALRASA